MLHDGELGKDLSIEHLDHALVDLAPAVFDTRHVVEDRAVFPKWTLLNVVDESNGGKVHVGLSQPLHGLGLEDISRFRGALDGAFEGHGIVFGNRAGELCGAEDVRQEEVVVETPDTVRASWLEGVREDETADYIEISVRCQCGVLAEENGMTYGSKTPSTISRSMSPP